MDPRKAIIIMMGIGGVFGFVMGLLFGVAGIVVSVPAGIAIGYIGMELLC
jgi:hypothetical protein